MKFSEIISIIFFFLYLFDSYQDIERIASRVHRDSPSKALINELGALNMTAEELARVLDQLKLEKILMYIKKYGRQLWFLTVLQVYVIVMRATCSSKIVFFIFSVKEIRERMKSLYSQLDRIYSKEGFREISLRVDQREQGSL